MNKPSTTTYILTAVAASMFTLATVLQIVYGSAAEEITAFNALVFGATAAIAVSLNVWLIVLTKRRRYGQGMS